VSPIRDAISPGPSALQPGDPARSDLLSAPSGVRSGRNPHEIATQFEAMLLKNMVEAMRKTSMSDDDQTGGQLVDHLIDDALANHLAKSGGIGLASFVDDKTDEPHLVTATDMRLHLDRWVRDELKPASDKPVPALQGPDIGAPGQ